MSDVVLRRVTNQLRSLSDLELVILRCTIDRRRKVYYDDLIPELLRALSDQVRLNKMLKKKQKAKKR